MHTVAGRHVLDSFTKTRQIGAILHATFTMRGSNVLSRSTNMCQVDNGIIANWQLNELKSSVLVL